MGVHRDDRGAALVGDALGDEFLQTDVDRHMDVLARLPFLPPQLADDAAERVHLDLGVAGLAAKLEVVFPLDAALADAEARQLEQRVARQLAFRDGSDIAQRVRHRTCERVAARLAHVDVDARQVRGIHLDPADLFPAQVLAHGNRHEGAAPADLAQDAPPLMVRHLDQPVEPFQHLLDVVGLLRHDDDTVILHVDGQRHATPVEHPAARRRQQAQADPVLVGQHAIPAQFDDLQVIHAGGESGEQDGLPAGQNHGPPGE